MPYKRIERVCEFCLKTYVGTKKTKSCKQCLGISSRYTALGDDSVPKHKFYYSKRPKLSFDQINIEETIEEFGYDPRGLSPFSNKKIVIKCGICGVDFIGKMVKIGRQLPYCSRCNGKAANLHKYENLENAKQSYFKKNNRLEFVDVEDTIKRFGYDPRDLTFQSNKPVVRICGFCGEKSVTNFCKFTDSCNKCSTLSYLFKKQTRVKSRRKFYESYRPEIPIDKINVGKTKTDFGYDPKSVSPYSANNVYVKCYYCNSEVKTRMHIFTRSGFMLTCSKCTPRKWRATLKRKYGVCNIFEIPGVQDKLSNPVTERIVASLLSDDYGIPFVRRFKVNGPKFDYEFDFYLPSINLLIECHGDYFHDFKKNGYSGTAKDKAKSTYVEKYTDYKLIWIWEHEIHLGRIKKILDFHIRGALEREIIVSLKDIKFTKIDNETAYKFLSCYHYLGNLGTATSCFGAFCDDNLIAVCAFGGPTRQTSLAKINRELDLKVKPRDFKELRRFCIKPNVKVKNLASYCLKRFVRLYRCHKPGAKLIISFADSTVGDRGTIYKASNWINTGETRKSYHYFDPSTNKIIHKKTVWDHASKLKMKESEFAFNSGLTKIDELPKSVWVKKL